MICSTFFTKHCPVTRKSANAESCWVVGASCKDPDVCDYKYEHMDSWGKAMFVTPGIIVDGKFVTNSLVDINLGIRILLGSRSTMIGRKWQRKMFVSKDPLGNPVDKRHPWNQTTIPETAEARLRRQIHVGHVAALVRQTDG